MSEKDFHATCRTCGRRGDLVETEELDGRMWILLTCGHWQPVPGPGEVVLSEAGNRYEVWGSFDGASPGDRRPAAGPDALAVHAVP